MALSSLKLIGFEEPFKKFRAHGLLTKNGVKMSKSKGNVVNPDDYYKKFGADTLRMYLMFIGPFSEGGDWQDKGIIGIKRFLDKVWSLKEKVKKGIQNQNLDILTSKTIKKVTGDLENLQYNTAVSALMILVNEMSKQSQLSIVNCELLLKLLAPFAPHLAEELWQGLKPGVRPLREFEIKDSIHSQPWPKYNPKLIKEKIIILVIQVNGKVRDKTEVKPDITEKKARELALSLEKIKKWIGGKKIKKTIFVRGKLINFVI